MVRAEDAPAVCMLSVRVRRAATLRASECKANCITEWGWVKEPRK